jgi:hypothetical protein
MLATGCVEVERRVGHCGGGAVDAEGCVVDCVLHHETLQAEVVLGDSTAACVAAAAAVSAAREDVMRMRGEVTAMQRRAVEAAEQADGSAAAAQDAAADAEDAAEDAEDSAESASTSALAADVSAKEAERAAADAAAAAGTAGARAADAAASAKAAADAASDALEAEAAARASEGAAARSAEEARGYDMRAFEYGQEAEVAAAAASAAAESAAAAQAEAEAQALAAATSAAILSNPFAECTSWAEVKRILPTLNTVSSLNLTLPKLKIQDARNKGVWNENLDLFLTLPHASFSGCNGNLLLQICTKNLIVYLPNLTGSQNGIMKHHNVVNSAALIAPKASNVSSTFRYDQTHPVVQMGHTLSIYAPNATDASSAFWGQHRIGKITLYAPKCTKIIDLFSPMMYNQYADAPRMSLTLGDVTHAEYAFYRCKRVPDGDFPSEWRFLKYGNQMFSDCELGRDLAISVLNSLQTATEETGTNIWCITMGIHVDHKTDEEVLAAIEAAEARGWTVAVQWNGTATAAAASTYGMRRAGIYARRCEAEEEGEQASLEWAHYVTNWEAHGYVEFGSVGEAAEFFGVELEPVAPVEE